MSINTAIWLCWRCTCFSCWLAQDGHENTLVLHDPSFVRSNSGTLNTQMDSISSLITWVLRVIFIGPAGLCSAPSAPGTAVASCVAVGQTVLVCVLLRLRLAALRHCFFLCDSSQSFQGETCSVCSSLGFLGSKWEILSISAHRWRCSNGERPAAHLCIFFVQQQPLSSIKHLLPLTRCGCEVQHSKNTQRNAQQ